MWQSNGKSFSTAAGPDPGSADSWLGAFSTGSLLGPSLWASAVESLHENEVCKQLGRTRLPSVVGQASAPPHLPGGGRLDALLEPGKSHQLLNALTDIFRSDPPNSSGRCPHQAGLTHGYTGTYARKVFSPRAVAQLLQQSQVFWREAPNVTQIAVPRDSKLLLLGDTHGQLEDVLWIFFKYGVPSTNTPYLFNGDIVDRGGHALEILLLLLALKRDEPGSVHVIRGNHEDLATCTQFGFKAEIESKYGQGGAGGWLFHMITHEVFPVLPVAAVISDASQKFNMCVLHGGLPVRTPGQTGPISISGDLNRLKRTIVSVQSERSSSKLDEQLLFNMLWADPAKPGAASHPGRGNCFTQQDTEEFCRVNQMHCLVRSHQAPEDLRGIARCHGNRCYTVFSASNYCGVLGNQGGVLVCDGQTLGSKGPQPSEHLAPCWPQLASIFEKHSPLHTPVAQRLQVALRVERGDALTPKSHKPAMEQVEIYVAEQIVKYKQRLFWEFSTIDTAGAGSISLDEFSRTMAKIMPDVPSPVWQQLIQEWRLAHPVPYVTLLHRFQITSELASSENATHVDVFSAMAQLRVTVSDIEADALVRGLDKDLSGVVDLQEFQGFLHDWNIQIPQWQTAALFEALLLGLEGRKPSVEDVLLSLALVSRSPASNPFGFAWSETARAVGVEIQRTGQSLVSFFRRWDENRNGFLSEVELESALVKGLPAIGSKFSKEQMQALVTHIDSQGVQNDRISLIEFLRALGPRKLAQELAGALLGEVLKPVYFYRSALETIFQRHDPFNSNCVHADEFLDALREINRQLVADGHPTLTESQAQSVCGIASGGTGKVQYRDFLRSLRVIDTVKRASIVKAGQQGLLAALQRW